MVQCRKRGIEGAKSPAPTPALMTACSSIKSPSCSYRSSTWLSWGSYGRLAWTNFVLASDANEASMSASVLDILKPDSPMESEHWGSEIAEVDSVLVETRRVPRCAIPPGVWRKKTKVVSRMWLMLPRQWSSSSRCLVPWTCDFPLYQSVICPAMGDIVGFCSPGNPSRILAN